MVKYFNSTWVFDLYLRQINIAHLNINQVSPVRYLEHYHENYFGELYPNPISSVIYLGFFNKIL